MCTQGIKWGRLLSSLFIVQAAFATTATVNGITWTYNVTNREASLGGGTSTSPAVPISTIGAITIPEELGGYPVTHISEYAFLHCSGVTNVIIPAAVVSIGNYAFEYCTNLIDITISSSVTNIGYAAFEDCTGLENITIPDGVTCIRANTFRNCRGLTSITIPDSVTSIENFAFEGCSGLMDLIIPSSVTTLGPAGVFMGCKALVRLTIPQCLCSYKLSNSFGSSYKNITDVTVGEGVTQISSSLFSDCAALKSVIISSTVTRMGDYVFKDCSALRSVVFLGDAPDVGTGIYNGTPRSLVTYVTSGSIGWAGGISSDLPAEWNERAIAIGTSGENAHGEVVPVSTAVSLTVTNVVVHYVLNSVVPEVAMPISGDTGFVTVVTEIKGGAVAIPESWVTNYSGFVEKFGNDFTAALTKPSGKRDAQGNALMVWQDYVAGTDPTKEDDVFQASITIANGVPLISYTPELPPEERDKRKYTIYGKVRLQDAEWSIVNGDAADYNFFKVTVEMK